MFDVGWDRRLYALSAKRSGCQYSGCIWLHRNPTRLESCPILLVATDGQGTTCKNFSRRNHSHKGGIAIQRNQWMLSLCRVISCRRCGSIPSSVRPSYKRSPAPKTAATAAKTPSPHRVSSMPSIRYWRGRKLDQRLEIRLQSTCEKRQ